MITASQAKALRPGQTVYIVGAWDSNGEPSHAKVNGRVQTWKTRPDDFRVPLKRGMYETGQLTPYNANKFTLTRPENKKPVRALPRTRR